MLNRKTSIPVSRAVPFEFPDDIHRHWNREDPEISAMANGASLTMPFLEPFLIKSIRDCGEFVNDPLLKEEIIGFCQQEAHHFKAHRRYNDILKKNGYPELEEFEQEMKQTYIKLGQKPLQKRMAYTAGFEAMTMGITKWIIGDRVKLFAGSDPRVASFMIWHMVEETEHKCVAFDAYKAVYGSSLSSYWHRMVGVLHGSLHVMWLSRRGYHIMLKKDGLWGSLKSRWRLWRRACWFSFAVGPYLIRAALPGHNPRHEKDLQWVLDWMDGWDSNDKGKAPLVDTHHPNIPVPFH